MSENQLIYNIDPYLDLIRKEYKSRHPFPVVSKSFLFDVHVWKLNLNTELSLFILLWLTGARVREVLEMKGKDIQREVHTLKIHIPGKNERTFEYSMRSKKIGKYLRILWEWSGSFLDRMYLFREIRETKRWNATVDYLFKSRGIPFPPKRLRYNRIQIWVKEKRDLQEIFYLAGVNNIQTLSKYLKGYLGMPGCPG